MKKSALIVSLSLLLAFGQTFAQDLTETKIAIASFNFYIDKDFYNVDMQKETSQYTPAERKLRDVSAYRLEAAIVDKAFEELSKRFESEHDITFLEVNYLENVVMFNDFGYPNAMAMKKAAKNTDAKYFCRIETTITHDNLLSGPKTMRRIKPKIVCKFILGGADGKRIYDVKGIYNGKSIALDKLGIDDFMTLDIEGTEKLIDYLEPLAISAVKRMIEAFSATDALASK